MYIVSFSFRLVAGKFGVANNPGSTARPFIPQLSRSSHPCGSESQSRVARERQSAGRDWGKPCAKGAHRILRVGKQVVVEADRVWLEEDDDGRTAERKVADLYVEAESADRPRRRIERTFLRCGKSAHLVATFDLFALFLRHMNRSDHHCADPAVIRRRGGRPSVAAFENPFLRGQHAHVHDFAEHRTVNAGNEPNVLAVHRHVRADSCKRSGCRGSVFVRANVNRRGGRLTHRIDCSEAGGSVLQLPYRRYRAHQVKDSPV